MRNIHVYDGKIQKEELPEGELEISIFQKEIIPLFNQNTRKIMGIVLSSKRSANYDPTNRLDAKELLLKLGYILKTGLSEKSLELSDFVPMIDEQFLDMKTGMCPQGRATRMYQLVLAFQ